MSDPSVDKLAKWHELSQAWSIRFAIAPERQGVKGFIEIR